ncbi:MAG: PIG-L family deacetylase [Candidatus Acidiferrales bacterium]
MIRKSYSHMRASVLAISIGVLAAPALAPRFGVGAQQSLPETVEAINKARIGTRVLFITAHPDDEWSSLLTYLSHGLSAEVGLLTITRGQGGQNAIGPEQGGPLGVIRTEELLAAGKEYGVRQFFTRAPDTGYVKTAEQARKIWGDVALEDMVRVIRTFRPQVVINGWGGVHGGHGHHQESGILTPQAVAAAADPKMFPQQLAEGLTVWKVGLELRPARGDTTGAVELPTNDVSPLWGKSYVEMGMQGHANHRSQGTPAFFGNSFFRRPIFLIRETEKGDPAGGFDAKLLAEPINTLAARFLAFQSFMAPALASADQHLAAARKFALELDRPAAAKSLAQAGSAIAALREKVSSQGDTESEGAVWELDHLHQKIDHALTDDVALPILAQTERHGLVAGENFTVEITLPGHSAVPARWTLDKSNLQLPPGWSVAPGDSKEPSLYHFIVSIPAGARAPSSPGDVILPFPPPLVRVAVHVNVDGYSFTIEQPVESTEATTTGIHTYPLELVPAVTLTVDPQQVMVPIERAAELVKLLARVRYHGAKPAKVEVGLDAPQGWSVQPIAPLDFSKSGDQLIRFVVTPPTRPAAGAYDLKPHAKLADRIFRTSLQPIPTLPERNWSEPAEATIHVMDLVVPAHLHVGYVAAENDPLPEILRQIGVQVDLLDEEALAFGDLGRYDAIVVGIRAYELRSDLLRSNQRLLDYVQRGGSLVVQFQHDFDASENFPAPYPAKLPEITSRVTDANSPVRFLAPENPLLNKPNKITLADFEGWVQERGLYFWGSFDSHYQPILGLKDPGESETTGSLVYAQYGKGVYVYTGLSFFRQLPAGVPGAYRLFVNLLSQTQRAASQD